MMKLILLCILMFLVSCSSTPKKDPPVCFKMTEQESKKIATWCIEEDQRYMLNNGKAKPKYQNRMYRAHGLGRMR